MPRRQQRQRLAGFAAGQEVLAAGQQIGRRHRAHRAALAEDGRDLHDRELVGRAGIGHLVEIAEPVVLRDDHLGETDVDLLLGHRLLHVDGETGRLVHLRHGRHDARQLDPLVHLAREVEEQAVDDEPAARTGCDGLPVRREDLAIVELERS